MDPRIVTAFVLEHVSQSVWCSSQTPLKRSTREVAVIILRFVVWSAIVPMALFTLCYYALASPPMHLVYDVAPPAGPSTIYIPGGGFSGFWFHLGFLQSLENRHEYDYYCYSSGCLGALAVLMNLTLDETVDAAFSAQEMWRSGSISRFQLVDHFFETMLTGHRDESASLNDLDSVLPNIKILVTSQKDGHQVRQPQNRTDLKDLLIKTTWVPYLTGWGFLSEGDDIYLDGGFSRYLHPLCEYRLDLPLIWETLIHTFSPGLTRDQVEQLWRAGYRYDYSIPKKSMVHVSQVGSKA